MIVPLVWKKDRLEILDQRRLPGSVEWIRCDDPEAVASAIEALALRGAPAIGLAAAYGVVLGVKRGEDLDRVVARLARTRPTAVNLFWALGRMRDQWEAMGERMGRQERIQHLEELACRLEREDRAVNRAMGSFGAALLPDEGMVLTHCNAGALATGGHGTALGVLRSARDQGKRLKIFADETRPVLQGARLTSWELSQEGMDVTVICDGMAAALFSRFPLSAVIVGADRVAANGDVANKIGTYGVAVAARYHGVPFYVAMPRSTVDFYTATGADIPIEIRKDEEVRRWGDGIVVAPGASVWNPAFDVTPGDLVSAFITEVGVLHPPFDQSLKEARDRPFVPEDDIYWES